MSDRNIVESTERTATWLRNGLACELIEADARVLACMVASGRVRTRRLPGESRLKYHRGDLEQVARECVSTGNPARVTTRTPIKPRGEQPAESSPAMAS